MDFGVLPPEINSARMYSGPGSGPLVKGHEELPGGGRENCPLVATRSARS